MLIAKVIGTAISTIKDEKLQGRKLLLVQQTDETGKPAASPSSPSTRSTPAWATWS